MKAWQFHTLEDWRLEDVPDPKPGPGEVVVRVRVVQPSVTEVVRRALGPTPGVDKIPQLLKERAPRRFFGHEWSGDVVAVGQGVTAFKPGERVAAITSRPPCRKCYFCREGKEELCHTGGQVGIDIPGCFAQYAALPQDCIIHIPDSLDYNEGATIQPLHTCMTSVSVANIELGDTIAILGQGVMGLGTLQIARASGAGTIITTDIRDANIKLSRQLGADHVINAAKDDPVAAIRELTGGVGPDIVYDAASGSPEQGLSGFETFKQAVQVVRDAGKVVQIALVTGPLPVETGFVRRKNIQLMWPGSIPHKQERHIVYLVSTGRVTPKLLINKTLKGLENAPEAFTITGNKAAYGAINPCQVVVA
ncbi:MAG: zinc-binding dehydrogenase [Chloroflexi bacterium]|nr:zinc-binding dehydrogenase [Chloroflexota bacterium]